MTLTPIDQCGAKENAIFYLDITIGLRRSCIWLTSKWDKNEPKMDKRNVPENKEILK